MDMSDSSDVWQLQRLQPLGSGGAVLSGCHVYSLSDPVIQMRV